MFDLHPGIHLDEIELAVFVEELEGAGAFVAHLDAGLGAAAADFGALFRRDAGRGRFLDNFLVAALHRAVAFAEVDRVAVRVRQHLDFDVARRAEKFFHVHRVVVERRGRFRVGQLNRIEQAPSACTTRMPRPPPPPAALMMTG